MGEVMVRTALLGLSSRCLSLQVSPSCGTSIGVIGTKRRQCQLKASSLPFKVKSNAAAATLAVPPRTTEELQDVYGRQGLRFLDLDGEVAVDLKLESGCKARLLLRRAQVTSYKAHMWHGGEEEMLHSASPASGKLGSKSLRGGIDLRFFHGRDPARSILPSSTESWSVVDVGCEPSNYAQITLINSSSPELGESHDAAVEGSLQFRYVVTLTDKSLSSALVVTNVGIQPVEFTGSIVTHLAVASVEAAFAVGLNGRSYFSLSPISTQPVDMLSAARNFFSQTWGSKSAAKPGQEAASPQIANLESHDLERGRWTLENADCSQLHGGEDRLYPTPPSSLTLMDRGFRRSVVLQRLGFEEFYISNPGPTSRRRDWDDFICVGPAQTTHPVRLLENEEWRAAQILINTGSD